MRLAIDVGGTFIDFVCQDERTGEVRTEKVRAAGELSDRLIEGIKALDIDIPSLGTIVHGSTMVLNSIVQERGATVGLVTTEGFRDVLELGRGNRAEIYNLFYKPPAPLVPRYLRAEVTERMDFRGETLLPLDEEELRDKVSALVAEGAESIAVCFINAYANPKHERQAAAVIRKAFPDLYVSISSDVVRERREFERTSTTVLNSFTQPKLSRYLELLGERLAAEGHRGALTVMQSTGGITSTDIARAVPVRAVQSGPAGGVIGGQRLSELLGEGNFIIADLGGTTFDVSLIHGGRYFERSDVAINGRPILQPSIDIVSIGAGGGSIVAIDAEGGLKVGPESAQAEPGPICYGFGGKEVTLTDALLVLGYFDPATYMAGRIQLDLDSARDAIRDQIGAPLGLSMEKAGTGIVRLATMNMASAIRQITIERGFDPRDFSMLCIGGGSGLFSGGLLDELEFKSVTVPVNPAVFSAWGLLNADYREDLSRSFLCPLEPASAPSVLDAYAAMEEEARAALATTAVDAIRVERFCEMRYLGQAHTLRVPLMPGDLKGGEEGIAALRERFEAGYGRAYAHVLHGAPLEITALRLAAIGETAKPTIPELAARTEGETSQTGVRKIRLGIEAEEINFAVHDRGRLRAGACIEGPAIVEEWNSTIVVNPGQRVTVDAHGNLIVEKTK